MSQDDEPWTPERMGAAIEAARQRVELERREQFVPFGIPTSCAWPASQVFHAHSSMGPAWAPTMTIADVEAHTLHLDYKAYPGSERKPLPRGPEITRGLESLIRERRSAHTFAEEKISLPDLAKVLEVGCGVTDRDQDVPRRATPSGGALYPVEIYPLVLGVEGLQNGIYHYAALDHELEHVRPLPDAAPLKEFVPPDLFNARPPVILAISVVFARTQKKYLERGYRFALLEAGHIAQNFVLTATALGMNSLCMGGYWDDPFNDLLGFTPSDEAIVYAVLLGGSRAE